MRHFSYGNLRVMAFLLVLTLILTATTSCNPVGDVVQGRSVAVTAWKSDADPLFRTDVVFEFANGRNLAVAHLTIDEDSFGQTIFGGFAPGAVPVPVPVTVKTQFAKLNRGGLDNE